MRFLIMSGTGEGASDEPEAPMTDELFTAYMRYNEDLHKAGVLVASEGLLPAAQPARVVRSGQGRKVVDGPYAEAKELVGGFYVIEVASRDDAIAWALRCPVGMRTADVLEIRQLTGAEDLPPEIVERVRQVAPSWSETFTKTA